jgi:NADPH:quinone reductase
VRALVCRRYGTPEDLELAELPDPAPGPGEILVGVRAAAANFADALVIANAYQVSIELPFVPGSELAGEVLAVGAEVSGLQAADLVFGTAFHGAFAERAVLPAGQVTKMPPGADFGEAAAFGVAYRTAYHALRSVAEVKAGDWVVVLGAAGGVGLAAVDIARELGARVVAAASGPEKLALCAERGAVHVIDYTTEDLKTRIRELTEGGAHAVIDPVGGPAAEQALRSVRYGGTFVTLGYASGTIPKIPLNLVLLKGVTVKGMEIRTFGQHQPELERRDREELLALFAAGRLRPHIGARFPLGDAAAALRYVADRRALGKVVIDVALPHTAAAHAARLLEAVGPRQSANNASAFPAAAPAAHGQGRPTPPHWIYRSRIDTHACTSQISPGDGRCPAVRPRRNTSRPAAFLSSRARAPRPGSESGCSASSARKSRRPIRCAATTLHLPADEGQTRSIHANSGARPL